MANTGPARENAAGIIRSVYESYGFEPVEGVEAGFKKKVGEDASAVEADAILVVNKTLEQLGIKNFAIYLSHHGVLDGILETVGVPADLHQKTFGPIRNFSKFEIDGFLNELQEAGVSEKAAGVLLELFLTTDEILNQEDDINRTVVSNLLNIVSSETLTNLGQILRLTGRTPVLIDPALACESPFSPGIVIEARTSGLDVLGGGGRFGEDGNEFFFAYEAETVFELMQFSGAAAQK